MTELDQNKELFFEKVRNIETFGDLFDLQLDIDRELKSSGPEDALIITDQIIKAIRITDHNIPFLKEIFRRLFECIESDDDIQKQIFNKLNGYLLNEENQQLRAIAIDVLSEYHFKQTAPTLAVIASTEAENDEIRILFSLRCLLKNISENLNFSHLLEVLKLEKEKIVIAAMDVFEYYKNQAPFKETQNVLEHIIRFSRNDNIRCRAIELLGIFGELDILERICMLPLTELKIQEAVHKMLQHIISKPRNILHLRPDSFEYLISECLVKLGYEQVEVTRAVKDDGVDVVAFRNGGVKNKKFKIIVQCKRYAKDNIGVEVLEQLLEKIQKHSAKEGQLITTSYFSKETEELAESHKYIELIDRDDLQVLLDKQFGEGFYCIINRA